MKCPTCKLRKTTDKQLGTVWEHEENCPTGLEDIENMLPFEALGNPNHPAYRKTDG